MDFDFLEEDLENAEYSLHSPSYERDVYREYKDSSGAGFHEDTKRYVELIDTLVDPEYTYRNSYIYQRLTSVERVCRAQKVRSSKDSLNWNKEDLTLASLFDEFLGLPLRSNDHIIWEKTFGREHIQNICRLGNLVGIYVSPSCWSSRLKLILAKKLLMENLEVEQVGEERYKFSLYGDWVGLHFK